MRQIRLAPLAALLLLLCQTAAAAQEVPTSPQLDAVVASSFKADEPGAAVLVMRDGKALLRKAYGLADVELGVAIQPEHIFRIGSITKQFTAVAILQLVEQGKISLADPIAKFFPDYPSEWKAITVEHLLTHTSGMPSYSSKDDFMSLIRTDLTPQQLIDTFKNDPLQFAPGERYASGNSDYVILGALIEKVTGQSYADYMASNVFAKAGLTHTSYDDPIRIIPKRVKGYDRNRGAIVNARYVSPTIPYSAGSIISTVDDLATWTDAVAAGKVVRRDLLDRAWTPYKLPSGEATGYGYGWAIDDLFGSRVISHGGRVMGFTAYALWMPQEKVFVTILSNTDASPVSTEYLARRLATYAIGKPWNPVAIAMTAEQLGEYEGVYTIDDKTVRTLTVRDGTLFSQRTGGAPLALLPRARDQFFYKDSFTTMSFERGADGKITAMIVTQDGKPERAVRTADKAPERAQITVAPEKLDRLTGRYQLAPDRVVTIFRKGNELWARHWSGREMQLFAESETKWFAKDAGIDFTFELDPSGKATVLQLNQGGRARPATRIGD
ncbi:MAG TPA: serine hydrolase [Thermoanaerobaculia bacterium]|jgi:CubicO group peptidase (beta-lactamase class C family)